MGQRTVFVSFPLTEAQEERLVIFIEKVRSSDDKREHSKELATVVTELVDAGLEHYFWKPVEIVKLGAVSKKMIRVGLNSGKKTLNVIGTKVIKSLSSEQIGQIVDFVESLQLEVG